MPDTVLSIIGYTPILQTLVLAAFAAAACWLLWLSTPHRDKRTGVPREPRIRRETLHRIGRYLVIGGGLVIVFLLV
jgi:hypothetical protein